LEGICRYARAADWHVQPLERTGKRESLVNALDFWKPEGAIVECGNPAAEFSRKAFGRLPVVWFDAKPGSFGRGGYVRSSNVEIGRIAAENFIELGFEKFAYVKYERKVFWCDERRKAFEAALSAVGRHVSSVFSSEYESCPSDACRRMMTWLKALPKPCGIFVANDEMTSRVLAACSKSGISVPEDVSLIGVDNDETICENTRPTLSSIVPDFVGGGYLAAKLLDEMIDGRENVDSSVTFGVSKVVVRESTRSLLPGTAYGGIVSRTKDAVRRLGVDGASVSDVVSAVGCSRRLVEMRFRDATGKTILEALNDAAFEHACDLLRSGVKPAALADIMGNFSRSTLERMFNGRTGVSVSEWSRQFARCAK